MDKKQFFESLISILPDDSGHRLESYGKIQELLHVLKSTLSSGNLQNEFEIIEKEILFHVWMFEHICNNIMVTEKDGASISWPLIVISFSKEILFVNKTYCGLSGLSATDIQRHSKEGTLYDAVYEWSDLEDAQEAISRLQAGKGYKQLELSMKHSGRTIAWNSYGGVGGALEIRSGREMTEENDQRKERERFYRGSIMNTSRLIENLYQVAVNGVLSHDNEQKLMWVQEFLSMFDFLWNHSEFFMEIIDMPTKKEGKIYGLYNTVYAQFLKTSFEEGRSFRETITTAHGNTILKFMESRKFGPAPAVGEHIFHKNNRCPVARVLWQYASYSEEILPEHMRIFSIGMFVERITKKNILLRLIHGIFKKNSSV